MGKSSTQFSFDQLDNQVLIIAEAGVNHNGELPLAKELIAKAADAGADYVKFQTFNAKGLVHPTAEKANYQKAKNPTESQFEMIRKLELSRDHHFELKECALKNGIGFLSTPFDHASLRLLLDLEIDFLKIPSGEVTNLRHLRQIAETGMPVVMSTGMCDLKEIEEACSVLYEGGVDKDSLVILHCNTQYPSPMQDLNLLALNTIAKELKVRVGYSDHSLGYEVPMAAVALGARVIEKHFTIDKTMEGPDHSSSLEPAELKQMVQGIRNIEKALGNSKKQVSESERSNREVVRRSIFVNKDMPQGHVVRDSDLIMLRPGNGISPMELDSVIGRKVKRAIRSGEMLNHESLT